MSDVALKEYLESKLAEMDRRYEVQSKLQDQALTLAKKELEHRLQGMNEFRAQLERQTGTFYTREKAEADMAVVKSQIAGFETWKAAHDGRAVTAHGVSIIALIISIVFGILHFLK